MWDRKVIEAYLNETKTKVEVKDRRYKNISFKQMGDNYFTLS